MSNQFSSGLELANVLVSSAPVHQSWGAIEEQRIFREHNPKPEPFLYISEKQQSNFTVVTFLTANVSLQGKGGLVSSSTLKDVEGFSHFEFLCNKSNPSFSVNKAAIDHFRSHFGELDALRTKIRESNTSVIITGHSLGGSVATLFTLFLLETLDFSKPKTKRPICITFGAPLIGDENLKKCVSQFSAWNSCFVHVASLQDPVPKAFLSEATLYKPFGTFLLVSDSGCACFEDPDSILVLLAANSLNAQDPNAGVYLSDYGNILEGLKVKALCKDGLELAERDRLPLRATIITQLAAIFGVPHSQALQQQQPNIAMEGLIKKMVTHEHKLAIQKTKASNAAKKLNDLKMSMAQLEWYKKESKRLDIGYYDMYKNKRYMSDINVEEYKKKLSNYWEDKVAEVENLPQKEGESYFRTRWLLGGVTYKRMVEPLHIAEYYKDGGRDYVNEKRPRHFVLLEKWLDEKEMKDEEKAEKEWREGKKGSKSKEERDKEKKEAKAKSVASSLNDDSCFWSHVEEALILCRDLKDQNSSDQVKDSCKSGLLKFENYVLDTLENFGVTPDIFLRHSSFMQWWNEYKGIVGGSYSSLLVDAMRTQKYRNYERGISVLADV